MTIEGIDKTRLSRYEREYMYINQVSRVLGRVRKVVTFFIAGQLLQQCCGRNKTCYNSPRTNEYRTSKLAGIRAMTCWSVTSNSRLLFFSALTDKRVKRNIKDVVTLSEHDVKTAEDIAEVLKTLKTVLV